jgi:large subunit ribosomal protein L24
MLKFKVGDNIKVTAGKDKGRTGKIEKVYPGEAKVIVPEVNVYKKHVKGAYVREGQKGGIYSLPRPIDVAKIAIVCPSCKKVTRVGFKFVADEKLRVCKKCGKEINTK